ncbi:MAG: SCO family protein [Candidatus Thiodiazotropha sp. (ex Epidulcina cf. delphinae)]|nr:SCO family protein [Candidatus Thiodiazotropha sp. (ex Epidulcina cf. delphinae)]
MKQNNNLSIGAVSLTVAVASTIGLIAWFYPAGPAMSPEPAPLQTAQALLLPELRPLKPFSLTDHQGDKFDNERLLGRWTFMSFGYTYCPDICPTIMSLFYEMNERLITLKAPHPYQITFVSVDPERDTPERLTDYVTYFNPSFVGATGPEPALQQLTKPLGILYERVETEESAMGYVMDHSASILLLDPQGRFHAYFSPPHDAEMMANDFIAISGRAE